jgi:hypothetical protein
MIIHQVQDTWSGTVCSLAAFLHQRESPSFVLVQKKLPNYISLHFNLYVLLANWNNKYFVLNNTKFPEFVSP